MERITNQSSESERRQATILFADISGFTAMSEKMDPEEVTSVMNSIFHLMEITIKQNGGHIDKFMGDCVMALFGAPSALENAPFMGVKTAIELRKLVYQYNADNKLVIPLDIHIGINTGSVVAGNVGGSERKDYTVMGDTVNLASRIESTAERGQILVGPETFKAVHKEIDFQVLKPISLKGKSEPIVLYEVLGIITEKNITDRSIFSRLVGRDEEMAILHHQVEKLINGKGGIISISGEAGIGKSRLMAEFKNGPLMKQTVLFEGRAISMGRSLSFYPIIDCLKHWAGIKEEDGDKEKLSKLANAVINQCPQEADEIIAFTARLMSIELTENYENIVKGVEGETLEKLIVKNIQKILIEGSIIQPLVLCLEDLHWADASSLAMLEQLFRLADKERILFILLFRPDYPETSGAILKILSETHHEYHIPITIEPLSVIETGILISNLLNIKGLPQILEKQIKERSGGNPFFIEEILRSFIDEGAVIKKGSGYEVTDKIGKVTVPFTVNEVLMSRIDRLDEQTKNVIKTASVIGRNFFYKILSNIAVNIPDLDSRLTLLEEMQFIHEKKRLDEVEFIFKHALAQEAAYESLLNQKRKEIHLKTVCAIELIFPERISEFYGVLAYHCTKGSDLDKAYQYLLLAGEEALKTSASTEAIQYYSKAVDVYREKYGISADIIQIAELEKNIGLIYEKKGLHREAIENFSKAIAILGGKPVTSNLVIKIHAAYSLGMIYFKTYLPYKIKNNRFEKKLFLSNELYAFIVNAMRWIEPVNYAYFALIFANRVFYYNVENISSDFNLLSRISSIFAFSGLSIKLSKKIYYLSKRNQTLLNQNSILDFYGIESVIGLFCGIWDMQMDEKIVKSLINKGNINLACAYRGNFSLIQLEQGKISLSCQALDFFNKVYCDFENSDAFAFKVFLNSKIILKTRQFENAGQIIEESIHYCRNHKIQHDVIHHLGILLNIHCLSDNLDEADKILKQAEIIYKESQKVVPWHLLCFAVGWLTFDICMLEKALNENDRGAISRYKKNINRSRKFALKISEKNALGIVETLRLTGTCYWLINKPRIALIWWEKAINKGEELNARLELSRTYFEIGKRILSLKKPDEKRYYDSMAKKRPGLSVHECFSKAETMFKEMNLEWDLAELEKIKSKQGA